MASAISRKKHKTGVAAAIAEHGHDTVRESALLGKDTGFTIVGLAHQAGVIVEILSVGVSTPTAGDPVAFVVPADAFAAICGLAYPPA